MDAENADSVAATVAMEEGDVAKRGEKREREEEETEGGGEEGQPAAKKPRAVAVESKESGLTVSSRSEQAASEQQPSYTVNSRSEESMTLLKQYASMYSIGQII